MNARTKALISLSWLGAFAVIIMLSIDDDHQTWALLLGATFLTSAATLSITSALNNQAMQTRRAVYGSGRRWDDTPADLPANVTQIYSNN